MSKAKRRENDFYPSPAYTVKVLREHVGMPWIFRVPYDPFCGAGDILQACGPVLKAYGQDIDQKMAHATEAIFDDDPRIEPEHESHIWNADTLIEDPKHPAAHDATCIITNPPYTHAREAMQWCATRGNHFGIPVFMLMRLGHLASVQRKSFFTMFPCSVYVLSKRPSFTGDGKTDASDYGWFAWWPDRRNLIEVI